MKCESLILVSNNLVSEIYRKNVLCVNTNLHISYNNGLSTCIFIFTELPVVCKCNNVATEISDKILLWIIQGKTHNSRFSLSNSISIKEVKVRPASIEYAFKT